MLNARDISEIRGMWKKENLCCDRFAACYVSSTDGIIPQESQAFLAMDEIQINRHIALIKKMLSKDLGNSIIQVPFISNEPNALLEEVRESRLKNEEAMEIFFEQIQAGAVIESSCVILAYHLTYDIPNVGTDGADQGESDDVYDAVLCMVCPTKMTKTSLAVTDGRISLTTPDRVIAAPITGFLWPAFADRCADKDSMIIYNADPTIPNHYLYERTMELSEYRTTAEIRETMKHIFKTTIQSQDTAEKCLTNVTAALGDRGPESIIGPAEFAETIEAASVPEEYRMKLQADFERNLERFHPTAVQLMDPAYIATAVENKKGSRMRKLLLRAAGIIEDVKGAESELVRELLSAADMQGGEAKWED